MCSKKRVCIFAAYDKDNILKSYVISYLMYLRNISDYIIFISDCFYNSSSIAQVKQYTDYHECSYHGEYDFGSYKRGITYLKRNNLINQFDELVLCNDSCLCVSPLNEVINKISSNCDFGGIVSSREKKEHIQSFFMLFKSNVFLSREFELYFSSVKKEKNFIDVVYHYEIPLKTYLNAYGFTDNSIFNDYKLNITRFPLFMLKHNCPLIKKKCLLDSSYSCQSIIGVFLFLRRERRDSLFDLYDLYNVKCFRNLIIKNIFSYPKIINLIILLSKEIIKKIVIH